MQSRGETDEGLSTFVLALLTVRHIRSGGHYPDYPIGFPIFLRPLTEEEIVPYRIPSRTLEGPFELNDALQGPSTLLGREMQRYKNTLRCVAVGTEVALAGYL